MLSSMVPPAASREYRAPIWRALLEPVLLAVIVAIVAAVVAMRPLELSAVPLWTVVVLLVVLFLVIGLLRLRCRLRIDGMTIMARGLLGGDRSYRADEVTSWGSPVFEVIASSMPIPRRPVRRSRSRSLSWVNVRPQT